MKIIEIIKNFFKSFKKDKVLEVEESKVENTNLKESFKKEIDVRDRQRFIELQKMLEDDEISVNGLSIFEVLDLIDLYNEQLS